MPTKPLHSRVDSLRQAIVKVKTNWQLFKYSVIVDRQITQKFVHHVPSSLDSALPKESSLLLQLFCQGQANNLHESAYRLTHECTA